MNYKILRVININFETIFDTFYQNKINSDSFLGLKKSFFDQSYVWCNSFAERMVEIGNEAIDIIYNFEELQNMWRLEYSSNQKIDFEKDLSEKLYLIFLEQIKFYKPDILYFQHCAPFTSDKLKYIKENFLFIKKIIFHNGFLLNSDQIKNVDIILASLPIYKSHYENLGIKSFLIHHYFDENILNKISLKNKKKNNVIFFGKTGSINNDNHSLRHNLIKELISQDEFYFFSVEKHRSLIIKKNFKKILRDLITNKLKYLPDKIIYFLIDNLNNNKIKRILEDTKKNLPGKTFLHEQFPYRINKSLYGIEMFQLLRDNYFALNIHSDQSDINCGNLRMFETTGVGSCLLTEYKTNLIDLFDPDNEVVTYKSKDELLSKLKEIKNNYKIIEEISQKGQRRTLNNHTTSIRINEIDKIIQSEL
tara:strand:+ start:13 stop:1275 length:1263 start_codon:yes stop_codon:yes gene_type:complete